MRGEEEGAGAGHGGLDGGGALGGRDCSERDARLDLETRVVADSCTKDLRRS